MVHRNRWIFHDFPSYKPPYLFKGFSMAMLVITRWYHMAVCQNLVPLVNIKIAGKWMFIPLKMVLIGIDPYPYESIFFFIPDISVYLLGSRLQALVKGVLRPSFAAAGLRPGDRVAALLPNGPEVSCSKVNCSKLADLSIFINIVIKIHVDMTWFLINHIYICQSCHFHMVFGILHGQSVRTFVTA